MEQKVLAAFLKDPVLRQSCDELEAEIDRELDKPEEEIDAAFVAEATLALLELKGLPAVSGMNEAETQQAACAVLPRKKRGGAWRFSLIAAAVCLLSVLSVATVSAAFFHVDIVSNFVQVYKDHIQIDFGSSERPPVQTGTATGLEKELQVNGFTNVMLPAAFERGYVVEDIRYDWLDTRITAAVRLRGGENVITINLTQYRSADDMEPISIGGDVEAVKELDVDGVAVFVLDMEEYAAILYANGVTSYSMAVPCEWEQALAIAQTIGE